MAPKQKDLLDEGNTTISVHVYKNGKIDYIRHATVVERIGQSDNYRYKTDDGQDITVKDDATPRQIALSLL